MKVSSEAADATIFQGTMTQPAMRVAKMTPRLDNTGETRLAGSERGGGRGGRMTHRMFTYFGNRLTISFA